MRYTITVCCVVDVNSLRELEECLEEVRYSTKSAIHSNGIVTAITSYPDNSGSAGLLATGTKTAGLPLEAPKEEEPGS